MPENNQKENGVSLKCYVDLRMDAVDRTFETIDTKYQVQFNAAKEAVGIAQVALEKQTAQALDGTKEAINKADVATDKRFSLLSEKIDGVVETINKNTGERGIYVTHSDLANEMEKLRISFEGMLRPVITFMNSSQGQSRGIGMSWQTVVTVIGVLGTLIAIFFALSK